jgi:tRNA(Arg) A34 adenosine deaminase TadA
MKKHHSRIQSTLRLATSVKKVGAGRLAATIWMRGVLISAGVNSLKTHPVQKRFGADQYKIFLHAETDAIVKALRLIQDFSEAYMYIARVKKDGDGKFVPALAKPCEGCMGLIHHYGPKGIFWTTDSGEIAHYGVR